MTEITMKFFFNNSSQCNDQKITLCRDLSNYFPLRNENSSSEENNNTGKIITLAPKKSRLLFSDLVIYVYIISITL